MTAEITREIQELELGMGLELLPDYYVSLRKPCVTLSGAAANAPGRLAMAAEMPHKLGMGFEFLLEILVSLPKPGVTVSGAAANAPGLLANVVELEANNRHCRVLVELPQLRFCENGVEWTVSYDDEVTIEGQVTPATIFDDKRLIGSRRNQIQLCPTEPWGISFNLPRPVDYWTTQVSFTTNNYMEILVRKTIPEAETSAGGLPPLADIGPDPDDDIVLVIDMVGGWLD